MKLDIVIVNWNTGLQLLECIRSLKAAEQRGVEIRKVVVIDNASSDGSATGLPDRDLPLHVIRNSTNRGFAAACNQGARTCDSEFILFLNPDTVLQSDSLAGPLRFMSAAENASVGICGIQLVDENGNVARSCSRFPTQKRLWAQVLGFDRFCPSSGQRMRDWDHRERRTVDQVIGAFFLIRRSLFLCLCGFDELFFVYFEEVDLSVRALESGFSSYYLAEYQAFHKGGGSSEQVKAKRLFYSLKSRILYSYKHFGILSGTVLLLATFLFEPCTRVLFALCNGSAQNIAATVEAYWLLIQALCFGFPCEGVE